MYSKWEMFVYAICVSTALILVGLFYKTTTASGAVTYCYITNSTQGAFPTYYVKGNVEWRPSRDIAVFNSYKDAQESLSTCPIGK